MIFKSDRAAQHQRIDDDHQIQQLCIGGRLSLTGSSTKKQLQVSRNARLESGAVELASAMAARKASHSAAG